MGSFFLYILKFHKSEKHQNQPFHHIVYDDLALLSPSLLSK